MAMPKTAAATPTLVAAVVLCLVPWAWQRTPGWGLVTGCTGLLAGLAALTASALAGAEPAAGVRVVVLLVAVVALAWLASREPPTAEHALLLALGLAALALWGGWQVAFGLERTLEACRIYGREPRVIRPFAPSALHRIFCRRLSRSRQDIWVCILYRFEQHVSV